MLWCMRDVATTPGRYREEQTGRGPAFWFAFTLFVVLPVLLLGARVAQSQWRMHEAEVQLTAALPKALERAGEERDQVRALLAAEGHVERTHSWRELICTVDGGNVEGNLWVEGYQQVCQLRSVDLYPVPPKKQPPKATHAKCRVADALPDPRPEWLWGVQVHVRHGVSVNEEAAGCQQVLGVEERWDDARESRLVDGQPPSQAGDWLVAVHTTPVSTATVGCHPFSLPCSQPGSPRLGPLSPTPGPAEYGD